MENASKALIMAGGVLVAILLLTLFAFIFSKIGEHTAKIYDELEESKITEFNQKFLNYDGLTITLQDVVSIVNLAVENNRTKELPTIIKVNVRRQDSNIYDDWADKYKWYSDDASSNIVTNDKIFIENMDYIKNEQKFSCKVNISTETKLVDIVTIAPS